MLTSKGEELTKRFGWHLRIVIVALACIVPTRMFSQTDTTVDLIAFHPDQSAQVNTVGRTDFAHHDSMVVSPVRLTIASAVVGTSLASVHFYQQKAWWLGERAPFWFKTDFAYAMNMDKLGHVYGSYTLSRVFGYTLSWCGFDKPKSTLYGAGLALGYQLFLEVEDGFRKNYGFDPVDGFSDIAGAVIPVLQESFPVLKNFSLKYSYYPSKPYLTEINSGWSNRIFVDDYDGMTVWLAMDPHFLMGSRMSADVPAWIGVSFGHGVRNLEYNGRGERVYYLTLDYNLSKIQTESELLHALFTALDFIHLPAPGIRLQRGTLTFGVFYR